MGFMLAPIQSRVTIPSFVLLLPSGRSPSLFSFILLSRALSLDCSLRRVLRIPFDSLTAPRPPSVPATVAYISRGSFAHHRLVAVLASRESEFLPPHPLFLAFSLPPAVPPFLPSSHPAPFRPAWLPSASLVPSIYIRVFPCISFLLVPSVHTHLPCPFSPPSSASCRSFSLVLSAAGARSRGSFPSLRFAISFSQAAGTRFPRSFCPVPFHHRCRAVVPSLNPPIRPSVSRNGVLLAHPGRARVDLCPSVSLRSRRRLVHQQFLPLSDQHVPLDLACGGATTATGEDVAFTSGSSLGPAPVSCFA